MDSLLREVARLPLPPRAAVPPRELLPGDVVAERFVVERLAGAGGMGTIHRGMDLSSGDRVAIKVMTPVKLGHVERFAREAAVLAVLSHRSIVRYVAHGTTPDALPFLVMEWLDGEDLGRRLVRQPLTVDESLLLFRRTCSAMAAAHASGIVHRDLKPSNLFLVDREPGALKVLDFGIARQAEAMTLTKAGEVLGTVGYMSPEQAIGAPTIDARTDVFALGCVLFECLTGQAAFAGPNGVAVAAKVLRDEPRRISDLRPGLGSDLDDFVARLLAKKLEQRPADAADVLRALDRLELPPAGAAPLASRAAGISTAEQRIVSVLLGRPSADHEHAERSAGWHAPPELIRQLGAEPIAMRNGALLIVFSDGAAATDQARHAARCALQIARLRPDLALAVATGQAETTGRIPVGIAIDRAAELLGGAGPRPGVALDALTAGLLDPSFELLRDGPGFVLAGERHDLEATRLLMGKPTPFVGRVRDLGLLELTLRECIDERVARAVLVTGPPGQGKSRLRHEFVAQVRRAGEARILMARADPMGAGSAFLLVRQLVRQAASIREGVAPSDQQAGLRAYVAAICAAEEAGRIADFLAELAGVPASEHASPEWRAARNDPQIMSLWLQRSFRDWLAAECARGPLLVVLEDLHWGDVPSAAYLGESLRALASRPFMLLALARPEVREAFPERGIRERMQEIALSRLSEAAAGRLVREALGGEFPASAVARIVACADGNAFFLEELIRGAAAGDCDGLPATVVALLQSRLERLDPEARRIVRAASLFGEVLWEPGVASILGTAHDAEALGDCLRALVEHEVLVPNHQSRFPAHTEYAFRHGLLRDAAYAMLTDADRARGHRLAGDWLERAGEDNVLTLADHFERGGEPQRAVPYLLRAVHAAADGGNVAEAIALGERGIACGAQGGERGRLRLVQAQALTIGGGIADCVEVSRDAMAHLPVGSTQWFGGAATLLLSGSLLGDPAITGPALQEVLSVRVEPEPSGPYGFAIGCVVQGMAHMGQVSAARTMLARVQAVEPDSGDIDPVFVLWTRSAGALLDLAAGELGSALARLKLARSLATRFGAALGRATAEMYTVAVLSQTGHVERAAAATAELIAFCAPIGLGQIVAWSHFFLAFGKVAAGVPGEAVAPLRSLLDHPDRFLVTSARAALAQALLACGQSDEAQSEAITAVDESPFPWSHASALRCRAAVELSMNRPHEALVYAERGLEGAGHGSVPLSGAMLRLTRAEALHALDRKREAQAAIREAREQVVRVGATLDDPELRAAYLTRIEVNARTLVLAEQWAG